MKKVYHIVHIGCERYFPSAPETFCEPQQKQGIRVDTIFQTQTKCYSQGLLLSIHSNHYEH